MQTIQDIFDKVNSLRDNTNIEEAEMLIYLNALESQLIAEINPIFKDSEIQLSASSFVYPLPVGVYIDDVRGVYVDGERLLRKKSEKDYLAGWYVNDEQIGFKLDDMTKKAVIQYYEKTTKHELENVQDDRNLVLPEAHRDLYVYHILAQIASKEGAPDYENYKNEYNTCLSECLSVMQKSQLFPNLQMKE